MYVHMYIVVYMYIPLCEWAEYSGPPFASNSTIQCVVVIILILILFTEKGRSRCSDGLCHLLHGIHAPQHIQKVTAFLGGHNGVVKLFLLLLWELGERESDHLELQFEHGDAFFKERGAIPHFFLVDLPSLETGRREMLAYEVGCV